MLRHAPTLSTNSISDMHLRVAKDHAHITHKAVFRTQIQHLLVILASALTISSNSLITLHRKTPINVRLPLLDAIFQKLCSGDFEIEIPFLWRINVNVVHHCDSNRKTCHKSKMTKYLIFFTRMATHSTLFNFYHSKQPKPRLSRLVIPCGYPYLTSKEWRNSQTYIFRP